MTKGKRIISVIISVAFLALVFAGIFGVVKTHKDNARASKTYVVSYDTDGGTYIEEVKVSKNEYAVQPEDPYKEGYTLQGWTLNGEMYDFTTPVKENIKLVAVYTKDEDDTEKVTVTLDTDGGSIIPSIKVVKGNRLPGITTPTKEGYVFKEWLLDGNTFDLTTTLESDITLKAKYVKGYIVTFDTSGGSTVNNVTVKKNTPVTEPASPIKEGYEFKEWQLDGAKYDFSLNVTKDITLTAKWKKSVTIEEYFTVSFNSDGGTEIESQRIKKNASASMPSAPTKEGYDFSEWILGGEKYDFNTPVTKDITLTATWEKKSSGTKYYTVTFDTKGGTEIESQSIKSGKLATKPQNPTKENYIFSNWYDGDTKFDFNTKIKKDYTITAKYIRIYKVTFDSDGGTEIESQSIRSGKLATKPTSPTKSGYAFGGWYNVDVKFDFNTAIKSDYTLKAKWIPKYTVTFDTNGGTEVPSKTVKEGKTVSEPTTTKSGYIINYWTLDGNKYDFGSIVTSDITLKAVWVKGYTVTFDSDGGSDVSSQKVKSGSKATKPTDPTKKNYTFKEWQLNGNTYDFSAKVTKNITLKAVWTASTYKVYFKVDDETYEKRDVCANCKLGALPDEPEKDGYTFEGWFDSDGEEYFANTKITKKTYLYAEFSDNSYTPTKYTISFDSDGGSSIASQIINAGSTVSEPANPTRSGYYFRYWSKNGTSEYDFSTPVNSSFTLIALWYRYTFTSTCEGANCLVTIKRNGTQITEIEQLKYNNTQIDLGVEDGKFNVLAANINSVNQVDVVLTGGTTVKAYKVS